LVLTADITAEAKTKALSGGAQDFLVKPFDLIEVGLRIKNLLETRYLHQQYEVRNRLLDEKVRERTLELEIMNQELIVARDKAEAGNRLKTAFMHNISHEVRTPLNGILGFGSLLADPGIPAEDKQEFLPLLRASSDRLINTITDYMDISLIASGNLELKYRSVNIHEELIKLKNKFQPMCNARNIVFNLTMPDSNQNMVIQTDLEIFHKIVSHLIDNSLKFTRQGSIELGCIPGVEKVDFFVKDTGVGIAGDARERIFEVFMQENVSTTRGHEGSGLGLSVIKGFLALLNGEIEVSSVKNEGSTFSFYLPNEIRSDVVSPPGEVKIKHTDGVPPVILVADDEYSNLAYLEIALKEYASTVLLAHNGEEAVELCRNHPEISLVFMDLKMPVMDGFEATQQIRILHKELPIIAVSAYAMSGDERRALEAGCTSYFAKPFTRNNLVEVLKSYGIVNSE
jgi:signal transduction histidine kinase/ActR/RegA family two-component response regulator